MLQLTILSQYRTTRNFCSCFADIIQLPLHFRNLTKLIAFSQSPLSIACIPTGRLWNAVPYLPATYRVCTLGYYVTKKCNLYFYQNHHILIYLFPYFFLHCGLTQAITRTSQELYVLNKTTTIQCQFERKERKLRRSCLYPSTMNEGLEADCVTVINR